MDMDTSAADEDDYLHFLEDRLSPESPILWKHHGIEISSRVAIPDDQEEKVRVKIYSISNPKFSFPDGFCVKGFVYLIRVPRRYELNDIYVTLRKFSQPEDKECICALEASGHPTWWGASLIPKYSFSQVETSRFKYQDRTVKIVMKWTTCYLVIGGK